MLQHQLGLTFNVLLIRSLGMSLASLTKIIKCAANNDVITMRADESHDVLALLFESPSKHLVTVFALGLSH